MIKKLQKRFIIVTMIAVIVVLTIIMVSINIINYSNIRDYSDNVLSILSENDGKFPMQNLPDGNYRPSVNNGMTNETPFETRFFIVKYNEDGTINNVDVSKIMSIDSEHAVDYANSVVNGNNLKGYLSVYRYNIVKINDEKLVIFKDCARELENANVFLKTSIFISLFGTLCVFVIVCYLSKKVITPIAKSYEKQKHFITDASHELKTPLTIISANNELTEIESGETESTKSIAKQVSKMTAMVKSLIVLSKIDEHEALKEKEKFNISDAVVDVIDLFVNIAKTKNIKLITEIEDNIEYIGDENIIRQLISILLDNAIKYSLNEINVSLKKIKNHNEFIISNNTNGIEVGDLNKYFNRFYRSDKMRASMIEGNGIGLSIAKEIVELHKGKIIAFSNDGKVFVIKIEL